MMSFDMEKTPFFDTDCVGPKKGPIQQTIYRLKTLYLLTASDLKTTLLPASIFALVSTLSGSLLTTTSTPLTVPSFLISQTKSLLWTYLNLLLFNLSNQRLPSSILEDGINKPWRAIPSGRLSPTSARHLLLLLIPSTLLVTTLFLSGTHETLFLIVLTYLYNDLGAGDEHFFVRHVNNAFGFITFGAGAATVACGPSNSLNTQAYMWLGVIAAVITFTIQFQDMEDQEGDRERERRTLPIVLGDLWTRRLNAGVIILFSIIAPAFWGLGVLGYSVPVGMGVLIAARSLILKSLKDDKRTFKLWCLWLVMLYLLPLAKGEGALWPVWN